MYAQLGGFKHCVGLFLSSHKFPVHQEVTSEALLIVNHIYPRLELAYEMLALSFFVLYGIVIYPSMDNWKFQGQPPPSNVVRC